MLHIYLRTLFMYLLLVGGIRILGKRQVGQMAPSEFVVTMMAANLATLPVEDPESAPLFGILSILTVFGAELLLSFLPMKSMVLRRLLCGQPVILIENGRVLQNNLLRTRVTLDELTGMLREKNIMDLNTVRYAILETSGSLSVFPCAKDRPATAGEAGIRTEDPGLPVQIISDGVLMEENLRQTGKDRDWVNRVLREFRAEQKETFLLSVDDREQILFLRKEGKR